jgi:hypothetical protein
VVIEYRDIGALIESGPIRHGTSDVLVIIQNGDAVLFLFA